MALIYCQGALSSPVALRYAKVILSDPETTVIGMGCVIGPLAMIAQGHPMPTESLREALVLTDYEQYDTRESRALWFLMDSPIGPQALVLPDYNDAFLYKANELC